MNFLWSIFKNSKKFSQSKMTLKLIFQMSQRNLRILKNIKKCQSISTQQEAKLYLDLDRIVASMKILADKNEIWLVDY